MKIFVALKYAADYPNNINPYDAVAVEAALRLREVLAVAEVVVVSIGGSESREILRTALAMGADRALFVQDQNNTLQPLAVAKILRELASKESPDLIFLGRQAAPTEYGQTGQMLAALLDWPQATFVTKLSLREDGLLEVTREVDQGLQVLALQLPAVITSELSLNEPRAITIPNILKAKQKPLETILLEDLAVDVQPRLYLRELKPAPTRRRAGIKVKNVAELLQKLRHEAKVL